MFNRKLFNEIKDEKVLILKLLIIKIFQLLTQVSMIFIIAKDRKSVV